MHEQERNHFDSFWREQPPCPWWRWGHVPEMLAVFATGATVLSFLYAGTGGINGDYSAVPGFDSFYHVKMAQLLPELGLIKTFPWLTTTIFADRFVSHHYGFHALLVPFLKASKWFGSGDPLEGARWAITVCFGGVALLFDLLLLVGRVRYRPLWLLLFMLMPSQFFGRHVFIRAICPSLVFMLLLLLAMFRRRYALACVIVLLYTQLYLGALVYAPILVLAYFGAGLLGPRGERVSWKLPAWVLGGAVAGLVVHPYGGREALEFLRVQVWGSGLDPDIPVGQEWQSYRPAWFFVEMSAVTLLVLAVSICVCMRRGRRLGAEASALLILNFVFLALTMKARRFIEYWPVFSVLSCAYLWAPFFHRPAAPAVAGPTARPPRRAISRRRWLATSALFVTAVGAALIVVPRLEVTAFGAEWRAWSFVVGALCLAPACRWWSGGVKGHRWAGPACALVTGVCLIGLVLAVGARAFAGCALAPAKLMIAWWWWLLLGAAYVVVAALAGRRAAHDEAAPLSLTLARSATGVLGGAGLCLLALLLAARPLVGLQRSSRCGFHLAAIREMMSYIKEHSASASVIFTDDWDVFGVFFYHNHHNRFIVGLDPKFTHERDPVLWNRYTRITQGKTPTSFEAQVTGENGRRQVTQVKTALDDIRDHFHADWVVVDDDHRGLARQLKARTDLARLVYTSPHKSKAGRPQYQVFRVNKTGAPGPPRRDRGV